MADTKWAKVHTLLSSELRASTGYSNAINAGEYSEAVFYLDVTTKEGTDPKLDLTLELSPDNITWFTSTTVFAQSVAEVKRLLAVASGLGMFVRFSYAITGTNTPKFTFSLRGVFKS